MIDPQTPKLDDPATESARRRLVDCVREIQNRPILGANVVTVELVDSVPTPVVHGLGRTPKMAFVSPPRGAVSTGRIDEIRSSSNNRTQTLVLTATGYGATITVDVTVF